MVLEECPYCHKLFVAEEVSKEEVDSNISKDPLAPEEPAWIAVNPRSAPRRLGPTDYPGKDFITYKVLYRCKHCGKEWTKMSEKTVDVPRSYVEDEEDEAQEAREREEVEEAKEEQLAREE